LHSRPLDRSRPLWELYLIHGLADGRIGIYTKVHHAAADGVSGNEILTILLDFEPEPPPVQQPPEASQPVGEEKPSALRMLGLGLAGAARQPTRVARVLPRASTLTAVPGANAFPGVPRLARALSRLESLGDGGPDHEVLEAATARAPRTVFNGPISPHRRVAVGTISLDRVKAIKNAAGTTVNDVLVALCAGALRNWLVERNALPEDPLVAMIPVSVRTDDESGAFGNRISSMNVPIPTNVADPHERLRRAHEVLRAAKERHRALPATLLTDAGTFVPPAVLSLAARATVDVLSRTRPPVNLVISNVPGPREPLYLAGARLEHNYPISVVLDGVGMNITVMSYRDWIDIGVVADREQVSECASLIAGIEAGLDDLER
jgi:diacylglycerol O-acyltransferase